MESSRRHRPALECTWLLAGVSLNPDPASHVGWRVCRELSHCRNQFNSCSAYYQQNKVHHRGGGADEPGCCVCHFGLTLPFTGTFHVRRNHCERRGGAAERSDEPHQDRPGDKRTNRTALVVEHNRTQE